MLSGCLRGALVLETIQQNTFRPSRRFRTTGMSPKKKTAARRGTQAVVVVPDKLYFRIGEVAELCLLPAYVLRFWETEFPQLKPVKGKTGQRMYRKKDVEWVLRIKKLLYDEGFTIAGARAHLREEGKHDGKQPGLPFPAAPPRELAQVRAGLQEILKMLSARR